MKSVIGIAAALLLVVVLVVGLFVAEVPLSRTLHVGMVGQAYAITADYQADGVDDHVEIEDGALDDLPAGGGKVNVMAGTYTVGETLDRAIDNVTIQGAGRSTIINYNGAATVISDGGQNDWVIRDLAVDAGGLSLTGTNSRALNVWIGGTHYDIYTGGTGDTEATLPTGSIGSTEVTDDTVQTVDLEATNAEADNDIVTVDTGTGGFSFNTPAEIIIAGTNLSWDGTTLNATGGGNLTQEQVQDYAGLLAGGNSTQTRITVTYNDATNAYDFVVDDLDTNLSQEEIDDFVNALINDGDSVHTRVTITYDDADDAFDFVVDDMNDDVPEAGDFGAATDLDANGALNTGSVADNEIDYTNVTLGDFTDDLGADPGHTHTGTSLSGVDISDDTNLTAGDHITLTDDDLDVDDAFLLNNASDTTTGNITSAGVIITTGNAFILGTTRWDDGSDAIDGEQIAADSIDDDSIDFSDITLADFDYETNWRIWYSNGSGDITELTLGANNTYLRSSGPSSPPTFTAPSGSGDVTSVGDCADGACLDGTSDGGTYIRIYDGNSHYLEINPADISTDQTIIFRDASGTALLSGDTLTGDITATFDTDGSTATTLANDSVDAVHVNWGDMTYLGEAGQPTSAGVGLASGDLDDTDASVEWENANDLDSDGNVTANSVALTTDTTGNYMADLNAGNGTYVTGSAGEGWTAILGIAIDGIVEAMLKVVNSAVDEDILTYEATTGDFEWHIPSELITAGTNLSWAGNTLNATGGAGDLWSDPVDSDIIPDTDDTYDIGNLTHEFQDAFFDGTLNTDALVVGALTWNTGDNIDGEQIKDDTIDDDSIDWGSGAGVDLADIPGGTAPASAFNFGGASSTIPWEISAAAATTTEGRAIWNSTTDVLEVGDGAAFSYLATGASDGNALAGDSATSFFDTGTIEHEYGGLEADVNAYSGLVAISGNSTSEVDAKSELEVQIADVADFAEADGDTYTGVHDAGGATSWEAPNSDNPTVNAVGEFAVDDNDGLLRYYANGQTWTLGGNSTLFGVFAFPDDLQGEIDNWIFYPVEVEDHPHGIVIGRVRLYTSASSSYSVTVEEWSDPTTHANDVETVATSTSTEAVDDGSIDHATIEAGNIIQIDLPTDDIGWVGVKITYYEIAGN